MFDRITKKIKDSNVLITILKYNQELDWANVYHDSIRGKPWLTDLPLNVGRMAGNYSFFYVLNRILSDYRPKAILEFGLGESSKVISQYIKHHLTESSHDIVEQDADWITYFNSRFTLSDKSSVQLLPVEKTRVNGRSTYRYENLQQVIKGKYDLYLVDGPTGSPHYSRYDIVDLTRGMTQEDEFMIMMDDSHKIGEQQTLAALLRTFKDKGIALYTATYEGTKAVTVVATNKYRFVCSL
ncbi:MAG: hypothetical protein KF687_11230 [Cyclobacteriaceae bacterium]|nr:hypothetical protein [Cyclobacteriaceae bacterium]